jgi:RNase P/RNase MRP subunit p29
VIRVLGKDVAVIQCANPAMIGLRGTVALESMHMITVVSQTKKVQLAKTGTVLQLQESGKLVLGEEMNGRIEDRLSRGARV